MTSIEDRNEIRRLQKDLEKLTARVAQMEAKVIVVQKDVIKSCTCLPSERKWYDIIQKYCRKCEATITE